MTTDSPAGLPGGPDEANPFPADAQLYPNARLLVGHRLFAATYKGVREENNHLLALDAHSRPIPHTYLGDIEGTPAIQTLAPAVDQTFHLDRGFLFYATPWHTNFQHFLTETFPKIVDYLALLQAGEPAIPLLVPHFLMNAFVDEVLDILGLKAHVILLSPQSLYHLGRLHSSSYTPNYDPPTTKLIHALRLLRDAARSRHPVDHRDQARRIYLGRDKTLNLNQNNANHGLKRVILNEGALFQQLLERGFENVLMGDLRIGGKQEALAGADIVVSPIGANLMNLLLLSPPYPRRVVILHSSALALHARYFRDLLEALFEGKVPVELFEGPARTPEENSPYELDLSAFEDRLRSMLEDWGSRMFPATQPNPSAPADQEPATSHSEDPRILSGSSVWVTIDPTSTHLRAHLEDTIDAFLDRRIEWVGFSGAPDALSSPGWEGIIGPFLRAGFRCLLRTSLPGVLTPAQLDLLSRLEELQIPADKEDPSSADHLRHLLSLRDQAGLRTPRVVSVPPTPAFRPGGQPPGDTRVCLDPWEGAVWGPAGDLYPCAMDPAPVGHGTEFSPAETLNIPGMRQRRAELLAGTLAAVCRTCPSAPWGSPGELNALVERHAGRIPAPEPPPTQQEIQSIIEAWMAARRRVLIYPAGGHAQWFVTSNPSLLGVLTGFGDRDPLKQADGLLGLPVHAPEAISLDFTDLLLIVAGDLEPELYRSLEPLTRRGIEVLCASRLHRYWRRFSTTEPSAPGCLRP